MAKLTKDMVMVRARVDLSTVKKLNCCGRGLQDISVLRTMDNLEVLSLSVNKISSLVDIQYCKNLKELYVRKNEIKNLNEICYLKNLPYLKVLWLGENPCSEKDILYRYTVIKNLPNLQKLDDVEVVPEEKELALKKGSDLIHPEYCEYENNSSLSPSESPVRASRSHPVSGHSSDQDYEDSNENRKSYSPDYDQNHSPPDSKTYQVVEHQEDRNYEVVRRPSETACDQEHNGTSSESEKETERQCTSCLNRCNSDTFLALKIRRNLTDFKSKMVPKDLGGSESDITTDDNREGFCNCTSQYDWRSRENIYSYRDPGESVRYSSSEVSGRTSPLKGDIHTTIQNSNLLSAVLCLIKELDYGSLQVVAVAVQGRMDEFESVRRSQ